jgi:hypothetical protein
MDGSGGGWLDGMDMYVCMYVWMNPVSQSVF